MNKEILKRIREKIDLNLSILEDKYRPQPISKEVEETYERENETLRLLLDIF